MKNSLLIILLFIAGAISAQDFTLDAEFRPRFELRNGYGSPIPKDKNPIGFVSQRSRLNFSFENVSLKLYTSLQNVNVWGDVLTTSPGSSNGVAFHQAWAEVKMKNNFSLKMGRQEISYDDERIFGAVGWVPQARSHDALVAKYEISKNHSLHLGLALNALREANYNEFYGLNQYQNMQFLHYNVIFNKLRISALALNLGIENQKDSTTYLAFNQTFGTRAVYTAEKIEIAASGYVQTGKLEENNLLGWFASANIKYQISDHLSSTLGYEYLSGTDQNSSGKTVTSFNPWFGTNHKFNGAMDYFYVGNHINSVGLNDFWANLQYTNRAYSIGAQPHVFYAPAAIVSPLNEKLDSNLGTEIDVTLGYKINQFVDLKLGYSQFFATETLKSIKLGAVSPSANVNNWGWVMVTINPVLFSKKS